MHGHSTHCSNIAYIDSYRLIADRVRRMKPANEVRVFSKKIRTEQKGMPFRNVQDCRVVSNTEHDTEILKLCADALDEPGFAQVAEKHLHPSTALPTVTAARVWMQVSWVYGISLLPELPLEAGQL